MSLAFAAAMLMTMAQAGSADQVREAYNSCLTKYTNASLDAKMSASEFTKAVQDQCLSEKQAFVASVAKAEMQYGDNKQEAESYANEEAQMMVDSFVNNYADMLASNSRLGTG